MGFGNLKQVFLERFWRKLKGHFFKSSNYLGCCTKSTPITAVDEPSKGLKIRGRIVERPAVPNDLWSTDTCEIDDGEIHSMKNISSVRTSIQVQNCHGTAGTSNSFEYVNHGLLLWNQTRQKWVGSKKPDHRRRSDRPVVRTWYIFWVKCGKGKSSYLFQKIKGFVCTDERVVTGGILFSSVSYITVIHKRSFVHSLILFHD
ncbi:hypothetical protein ZOSMA_9G00800 [Zostera marina]|uniref:Gag1-like clamp domain-containing protein n=1 Tax=Zostera marina TaxID=29655 RepID=A0A0K9NIQ9_ZOSMR|nr:hypothetical protein ZOSMA_9G00800 [Zostera marina]